MEQNISVESMWKELNELTEMSLYLKRKQGEL